MFPDGLHHHLRRRNLKSDARPRGTNEEILTQNRAGGGLRRESPFTLTKRERESESGPVTKAKAGKVGEGGILHEESLVVKFK